MIVFTRPRIAVLLCLRLTRAAPSGSHRLAKRGHMNDGLIAAISLLVLLQVLIAVCWCMATCCTDNTLRWCCCGCGGGGDEGESRTAQFLKAGPSYWLYVASRGRYGAPPKPWVPPPPEVELIVASRSYAESESHGVRMVREQGTGYRRQPESERSRHRWLRSHSQVFREAERLPAPPKTEDVSEDIAQKFEERTHKKVTVSREAVDDWRMDVAGST
ncbi:hypothetical protein AURDEDRAFT_149671 [Auricularia subglabra TFB-10046 SS5]|nr:hypothetical protein AURDEDRAFT_149671 [Auricularia subglabra TFB-10046 SS5]